MMREISSWETLLLAVAGQLCDKENEFESS